MQNSNELFINVRKRSNESNFICGICYNKPDRSRHEYQPLNCSIRCSSNLHPTPMLPEEGHLNTSHNSYIDLYTISCSLECPTKTPQSHSSSSETPPLTLHSCIHIIPLPILLLLLLRRRRWCLLLDQIFPVERTCRMQLQPGRYTLEIEHVIFVAREADDEWIFIWEPW